MVMFNCRALALRNFSTNLMILFIRYVLSVPASMLHLYHLSPEVRHEYLPHYYQVYPLYYYSCIGDTAVTQSGVFVSSHYSVVRNEKFHHWF